MNTVLRIKEDKFLINDKLTYQEIPNCNADYHGLLMNMRMIQGVFDEKLDRNRFCRFGKDFDPEKNTDELVENLKKWYHYGIRAVTVGFQGGGPCFTIDNYTMDTNPFSEDGLHIDKNYTRRMAKIIKEADQLGMVVIVSYFYGAQTRFLKDDKAVECTVKTVSNWIRDQKFQNVIIEIANEQDGDFKRHPVLYTEQGIVSLIEMARKESGGRPVGCSRNGGSYSKKIAEASDVILIHGNDQRPQKLYELIRHAKEVRPLKPIIINEDSQAISQMIVSFHEKVSWGYYNNMTKQEPPTCWGITKGEDQYFALRLASFLGIDVEEPEFKEQFYIQGLEKNQDFEGKRWVRLASLYPERIAYVDFYRDGKFFASAFEDPFTIFYKSNWLQGPVYNVKNKEHWIAIITLKDGTIIEKSAIVGEQTLDYAL